MPRRPTVRPPARLDQSVTRVLARLGGLAVVAAVMLVVATVWRTVVYSETNTFLAATQSLQLAHAGMLDEETGLRGYLAGRQAVFLQPYTAGQVELAAGNAGLQKVVGADPGVLTSLVNLRIAQQAWITGWAVAATATQPPADLDAFLQQGKALFDTYRAAEATLQSQLATRIGQLESQANAIVAGGLFVETVLMLAGAALWWRSRQQLRATLVGPVTGILDMLGRFEGGDYTPEPGPARGPAELRSITARLGGLGRALGEARATEAARAREAAAHADRLRLIVQMGREITGSLNLRYVLNAVCRSVLGIGVGTRCVIWLTDETTNTLVPSHDSAGIKGRVSGLTPVKDGDGVIGKAARFGRIIGPEAVARDTVDEPWDSAIAIPMIVGARVIGVIEAGAEGSAELPTDMLEVIDTLASQAATAIEAARLYERAEHLGRTDALTQLPNRLELDVTLTAEVSRAARYGRPLSIAMLDLDHFKKVNDDFGHARGDAILQQTAAVMRQALRDTDTIYRYGGEEFLLLMPETDAVSGFILCDRVREAVTAGVAVPGGDADRVTLSCGVASFPADGNDAARLVAAADGALYEAKRSGRDRVEAASHLDAGDRPARVIGGRTRA